MTWLDTINKICYLVEDFFLLNPLYGLIGNILLILLILDTISLM